eukprot:2360350-Amphidinium_carterae.5
MRHTPGTKSDLFQSKGAGLHEDSVDTAQMHGLKSIVLILQVWSDTSRLEPCVQWFSFHPGVCRSLMSVGLRRAGWVWHEWSLTDLDVAAVCTPSLFESLYMSVSVRDVCFVAGALVIMDVANGQVSWDRGQVRSKALANVVHGQHYDGGVASLLQHTHDLGANGLWLYKQLSLRVAECLEAVLAEGPVPVEAQPLGHGKRKRQTCALQWRRTMATRFRLSIKARHLALRPWQHEQVAELACWHLQRTLHLAIGVLLWFYGDTGKAGYSTVE